MGIVKNNSTSAFQNPLLHFSKAVLRAPLSSIREDTGGRVEDASTTSISAFVDLTSWASYISQLAVSRMLHVSSPDVLVCQSAWSVCPSGRALMPCVFV